MKRSSQHVLSLQHPPPDFYTCQTTLSEMDPVGIACRIVNSKVEYVSVTILSYTKEWFLDTNNKSSCFVPTNQYTMCRYWFPLLKDKTTWENFGLGWYLSNLMENSIHLDISRDVAEAFTASQPLVYQYLELFRSSSSVLDFLFKLCNVPSLPSPYCQGDDLQKRLTAKERELFSSTGGDDTTCQALKYPSQNERVLGEMVEWKQELRSFLEQLKKDMSTNFTLTTEQNEKNSKLLETLHLVQPSSSESSAEPTVFVDEIKLKQKRDQLKVERDRLKEENDQLKAERNQLKKEKGQLWKKNDQLKAERNQLKEEKGQLKAGRKGSIVEGK
ncbi:uncharacterized protein TNCV_3373891 [Trichonephila clavipes]|nr:uncharacterized protein TNCV_3373891 [Trichonephila clavipes]